MKKVLAILLAIAMIAAMAACAQKAAPADETKTSGETTSTAGETVDNTAEDTADTASSESYKIFLITMDQMDQYWTNIDAGCKKAAEELGNVEYQWTAPDVKDDAKQIEMINNAVANGANAILLAANGPEAVNDALKEASAAGVQIVYVDSPANFTPSVATFSTDNTAAGKTAGQTMIDQLAAKGITEGKIGIVSVNAATASTVARDDGFRSAFEGTKFELQESQYCDGDAARSKDAASAFIADGCVGVQRRLHGRRWQRDQGERRGCGRRWLRQLRQRSGTDQRRLPVCDDGSEPRRDGLRRCQGCGCCAAGRHG